VNFSFFLSNNTLFLQDKPYKMRVAAIYIPEGTIPHIFGKGHEEMTINLGGKSIYTVSGGQINFVKPNTYFIDDIFSKDISLLSAVVGSNGGGKSTLLRLLTSSKYDCSYVLEYEKKDPELVDFLQGFHRVYYTPYLNNFSFNSMESNEKDLSKLGLLKSDNHGDSDSLMHFLEAHESENMKRWIKFNHFFKQHPNNKVRLPTFNRLTLSLRHFDLTVFKPNEFHNTAYQLRNVITLILEKIQQESKQKEIDALEGQDTHDDSTGAYFPIRFIYDLYELALAKLVSIFEGTGNRYLNEGIIPEDYKDQLANLDVHNSMIWFLRNGGVYLGQNKYSFAEHIILIELIDYIVSLLDVERITDNWREIEISEAEALQIIELYDRFNESFINEWFKFDTEPMFSFRPHVTVSSGEQSYFDLFSTLYYHAGNIKAGIDIDEYNSNSLKYIKEDILLLLDEGDNAFHPQWKKEYVKYLRDILPTIFPDYKIQVVIISHDPLTLSDLPKNNVVYLEKSDGITRLGKSEQKRTLGANISDLLKDSFFLEDGQIGGFIAVVIDKVINDIRNRQLLPKRKEDHTCDR